MNIREEGTEHVDRVERVNRGGSGLVGFLIGGLIGAGAMLLLAPQPGSKTREEVREGVTALRDRTNATVKEKVEQAKSRAQQVTAEAREKVAILKEQGRGVIAEQLDRVSTAAEAGKKALNGS
jgi:gas vesicle protein